MQKVIITGANGVGKSTIAARLGDVRPNIPIISYDGLKLQTNWQTRPVHESLEALRAAISTDKWILEGGPSMLQVAIDHADGLIWLDPPEYKRAWRLFTRPLKSFGRTRAEIPDGNVDWPIQQYKFAWRSIKRGSQSRAIIAEHFDRAVIQHKWQCNNERSITLMIEHWAAES